MSSCNESYFYVDVLAHFHIENHVTLYLLETWWDLGHVLFPWLKRWPHILHFFADCIPPEHVSILHVQVSCLFHSFRDLYSKLVGANPILRLYLRNDPVSFLQCVGNPPGEGGFHGYPSSDGIFCNLDWV